MPQRNSIDDNGDLPHVFACNYHACFRNILKVDKTGHKFSCSIPMCVTEASARFLIAESALRPVTRCGLIHVNCGV